MIVPMKKLSIIVQSKDAASAVERLRSLGVVHVEHEKPPGGKDINAIREDMVLLEGAIGILSTEEFAKIPGAEAKEELADWRSSAEHITDAWKRLDQVQEYVRGLKNAISEWEPWGEFDPEAIRALAEKKVYIKLYRIPLKKMKEPPSEVIIRKLFTPLETMRFNKGKKGILDKISNFLSLTGFTSGGAAYCALISDKEFRVPFEELALPKAGLKELRDRLDESKQVIAWIKENVSKHVSYRASFVRLKKSLGKELEFNEALSGMGQSGEITYLRGYIPYDVVEPLLKVSKEEKWGIAVDDTSEEDKVPTLVRNPGWVSIIAPVFKMIEIVPGYSELDISLWFLIFFSIFFGMLIGDAGYGAIFFALTILAQLKFGKNARSKSHFFLFYLLSLCAIIWGVLTGTFFGQEWLPQSVKPLIPALRDNRNIQALCFFLGALHLSIAHLWRILVKLPSLKALADVGWTVILWGAYFLARMLILGYAFPAFGKWFFIAGPLLVIFFTNPTRNILKAIGSGFGSLLLNFVNSFTDIVSYIRLFAVGLATVAIADAFNKMAMDIGYNTIMTGVVTSLILLIGHVLNIILGPLAILVHGVRLNVLEFCSHLDIKWSGFSYKPLAKGDRSEAG